MSDGAACERHGDLFWALETGHEQIHAAGWRVNVSSSGRWWWKHQDGKNVCLPKWVREQINSAYEAGRKDTANEIRLALGFPPCREKRIGGEFEERKDAE